MNIIAIAILIPAGLFSLDQFGLWLERRGWLYYRKIKRKGASCGNPLVEIQAILEPDMPHGWEKPQEIEREERAGDPPTPGGEDRSLFRDLN